MVERIPLARPRGGLVATVTAFTVVAFPVELARLPSQRPIRA